VAELGPVTAAELRTVLAPGADVGNPVDLTPAATAAQYRRALEAVLADEGVDAAIVLFMPPLAHQADEVASAILDAARTAPAKPVVTSFLGDAGVADLLRRGSTVVPTYTFPESAAVSLGHAAAYQAWRSSPAGVVPDLPDVDAARARELLAGSAPGPLPAAVAAELIACYGLPVDGASGGAGLDAFVAVRTDPVFGPVVSVGLTGAYADLMDDVAHGVTPLSDRDVRAMLGSLRAAPLLDGRAGGPGVALAALEETVLRVSAMVEDLPEIAALELRPVHLLPPGGGVRAARATIHVVPVE
jgi:acyl-CoA synthetase (NDP forming)